MPKYQVLLKSGRDFILNSPYHKDDVDGAYELAWEAVEEASLSDDYLVDVRYINE